MKDLQLPLTTNWFNITKSGEKKEDYRAITNYWFKRLFGKYVTDPITGEKIDPYSTIAHNADLVTKYNPPLPFKNNIMTLGYPSKKNDKDAHKFLKLEHKGIEIREGNPDWGAVKGVKYFVIKHGNIIV